MKRVWDSRGLGIVLLLLFLGAWILQAWTGWREFQSEQESLGEAATVLGSDGYVWTFFSATMENWQSEFLQLLAFVVLTSFLIFKGSPESRDGQDEMMAALQRIEARMAAIETRVVEPQAPARNDAPTVRTNTPGSSV